MGEWEERTSERDVDLYILVDISDFLAFSIFPIFVL